MTDPDARSMNSAGKGTGTVGYNVQTAVDAKNHIIVAHEVTNITHDRDNWRTTLTRAIKILVIRPLLQAIAP